MTLLKTRDNLRNSRPSWRVGKDSWHYRLYMKWNHGRMPANENFCHYWRQLLLWLPLTVLAFMAGILAILAVIVIAAAALYNLITGHFIEVLIVAGGIIVLLVAMGILAWLIDRFRDHLRKVWEAFWYDPIMGTVFRPWMLVSTLALGLLAYFRFDWAALLVLGLVGCILLVLIGTALVLGVVIIWDHRPQTLISKILGPNPHDPWSTPKPKKDTGSSTLVLLWQVVKAIKNRYACPMVEFPKE